ncbi:TOX high mobility group box family member 4b isoform X1 [Hypanus sabinus]|uniref:TOX high mobility group box family member 4b isoform X1 n=1 Tax=Hypanus sabinus TaxID=79690 RepID=UPI0028C3EAC9|nr:TOX high mobility group box family member 4b isoform X1 [Hypanus sabinus]XP_059806776.1 TOX high mobility group box family member 4b isoform X1 [Hypanus sabinus]
MSGNVAIGLKTFNSTLLYASSMNFPGSADTFLTISDSSHPFLSGAETFHTPSLGDEEFEIPPISLPLEADADVACHFDLSDPASTQDNGFSTQFTSAPLELSLPLSQGVMEPGTSLVGSLSVDLGQPVGTQFAGSPLTTAVSAGPHASLTTIDQSELSTQLGLGLGASEILGPQAATGDRNSPPPSPASSTHEEEGDDFRRGLAERPPPAEGPRKGKGSKRRRKKDPNEPQKPVSAYALFFRDTQAAIKGQNPNATFGEVSKIVASMWDSLGEEQKQIYKRKTEAAKKEYLKALASYRAGLETKTAVDSGEGETQAPAEEPTSVAASLLVPSPSPSLSRPPSVTTRQMTQGLVTVLAPTPQLLQLQIPATRAQRLQAPPPLQPMPPPPLQAISQPRPPPLQAAAQPRLRPGLTAAPPPPPPLQVQIIQLQPLAPAPTVTISAPPAPVPSPLPAQRAAEGVTLLTVPTASTPAEPQVENRGQPSVELVTNSPSPVREPTPGPGVCVRRGCNNSPVPSPDWDNEYCSSQCVVQHCRDVFMAWVSARNQSPVTSVK